MSKKDYHQVIQYGDKLLEDYVPDMTKSDSIRNDKSIPNELKKIFYTTRSEKNTLGMDVDNYQDARLFEEYQELSQRYME